MSACHRILSVIQILILIHTYTLLKESKEESVRDTVHFVLLVHFGVSVALTWKGRVTPNTIGLSLYTLAGSLSLGFISYVHGPNLWNCSMLLTVCGLISFVFSWWTVYKERFQNLW